jgi:hypothetical protein
MNMNEFDSVSEQSIPRVVIINADDNNQSGEFKCMKLLERNSSDIKALMNQEDIVHNHLNRNSSFLNAY